jgi:hypothetical protein
MTDTQTQDRPAEPATANDPTPPAPKKTTPKDRALAAPAARSAVRVTFTDEREFYEELRADADLVEHRIVRAIVRRTPPDAGAGMQQVDVVAGYIARGQVVELVTICGVDWHTGSEADNATDGRAERVTTALGSLCHDLQLDLRPGRFGQL